MRVLRGIVYVQRQLSVRRGDSPLEFSRQPIEGVGSGTQSRRSFDADSIVWSAVAAGKQPIPGCFRRARSTIHVSIHLFPQ